MKEAPYPLADRLASAVEREAYMRGQVEQVREAVAAYAPQSTFAHAALRQVEQAHQQAAALVSALRAMQARA